MEKNTHERYNTYVGKTIKNVTHMYAKKKWTEEHM